MFSEYKAQVIRSYEKKRDAGKLPLNLQRLTPAKLKQECLTVISERYRSADERILKNFFGNGHSLEEYVLRIKKTSPDKFRPLINHLKEKTENSDEKNIDLLAWLIDFNPRPYLFGHDYQQKVEDGPQDKEENDDDISELRKHQQTADTFDAPENKNNRLEESSSRNGDAVEKKKREILKPKSTFRFNNTMKGMSALGLTGLLSVVLLVSFGKMDFFKEKNCMYWTGTRYKRVYFDQKIPNVQVVALDTFRLNYFRKIAQPDTLKENCVGKIWYSKINNKVEFFTTGGMHPEHIEKPLKPVSEYIFNKYILKKEK